MKQVLIESYGTPWEVARCAEVPDVGAPAADEVVFDVLAFPINPADMGFCRGTYRLRPPLPATPGAECVGRVTAVGAQVKHLKPGDLVINLQRENWAQKRKVKGDDAIPLPAGIDLKQAAMVRINPPTAALMLSDFVDLKGGDWVIQNVANSAVGRLLIVLAHQRGLAHGECRPPAGACRRAEAARGRPGGGRRRRFAGAGGARDRRGADQARRRGDRRQGDRPAVRLRRQRRDRRALRLDERAEPGRQPQQLHLSRREAHRFHARPLPRPPQRAEDPRDLRRPRRAGDGAASCSRRWTLSIRSTRSRMRSPMPTRAGATARFWSAPTGRFRESTT